MARPAEMGRQTYEMNICKVKTEVWQSSRMKLDASKRHSEGYFFDVNSIAMLTLNHVVNDDDVPIITGIPLSHRKN